MLRLANTDLLADLMAFYEGLAVALESLKTGEHG